MKIQGESTSVKVLPWDPFATFNVAVIVLRIKTYVFMPWARLYHSNRKQSFTFELEEGRVVIEGFINEINNKLSNKLPSRCCHGTHLQHSMWPC
jgi:hypothetical protein